MWRLSAEPTKTFQCETVRLRQLFAFLRAKSGSPWAWLSLLAWSPPARAWTVFNGVFGHQLNNRPYPNRLSTTDDHGWAWIKKRSLDDWFNPCRFALLLGGLIFVASVVLRYVDGPCTQGEQFWTSSYYFGIGVMAFGLTACWLVRCRPGAVAGPSDGLPGQMISAFLVCDDVDRKVSFKSLVPSFSYWADRISYLGQDDWI